MTFSRQFLNEASAILERLDTAVIHRAVFLLAETRRRHGRLFILGVGGSAANASHAVNDFRKIAGMEAYAPTDNVSELSARTNDEGWATVFESWLRVSRLRAEDTILVLSLGGGVSHPNRGSRILVSPFGNSANRTVAAIDPESVRSRIGGESPYVRRRVQLKHCRYDL